MIHLYLWGLLWIWDLMLQPPAKLMAEVKIAAEESFRNGDYLQAAEFYKQLANASIFSDPSARMNMANAYLLAGETDMAYRNYVLVSRVDKPKLAAKAISRLGMIALEKQDTVTALASLRKAVLIDRSNRFAIADYEVLRYRFSGEIEVEKPVVDENSDLTDSLPQPGDVAGVPESPNSGVVELSDQREQLLQNLDKINMSEEQAKSVLDAMKVNERQYIYQLRMLGARNETGGKIEW